MSRTLPFVKMHGIGNDFVVLTSDRLSGIDPSHAAQLLCQRRFGVGADGLLIIGPATDRRAAFSFRMHNPDGTPDMCGNGLRCAVLYAHHLGLVSPEADSFLVETVDGLLAGRLLAVADDGLTAEVRVEMATPRLRAAEIPFSGAPADAELIGFPVAAAEQTVVATMVNTGSTHTVVFVDDLPDDYTLFRLGPALGNHASFPERTSVMWARQTGLAAFSIRIWERGAGETLGCGTGACAVGAAAILNGRAAHGESIQVASKGGTLVIDWPQRDGPVWLTGPAQWVFGGEFLLEPD